MGTPDGPGIGRWLLRGAVALAGLAVVVLAFLRYDALYEDDRAVLTAPVCGTPAAAQHADCVRLETGWVTGKDVYDDSDTTTYVVTVGREKMPDRTFRTGRGFHMAVHNGDTVELRIWQGRVAVIDFRGHRTMPDNTPWFAMVRVGLLAGVGTAVLVAALTAPGRTDWAVPVALAVLFPAGVWFGGAAILGYRWPTVLTFGVPSVAWLLVTVAALALASGGRSYGRPSQAGKS